MKRKLSAIIALVLAVVMVFPTAVFVGAAANPMSATVVGDLIVDGLLKEDEKVEGAAIEITMAAGASASYVIKDQPADTTLKFNTNGKTAIGYDEATCVITAEKAGTATLTITAEKKGEAKATVTIAVTVVPKEITKVVLSGTGHYLDPYDTPELDGYEQYNAGDTLTINNIYVEYNNAEKDNVTPSEQNLALKTYNKGTDKDTPHKAPNVALVGDDTKLRFEYTDGENLKKSGIVSLNVTTSGIDKIWVDQIDYSPVNPEDKDSLTADDLLKRIQVGVDYTELSVDVFYYAEHEGTDFIITFYEDSAYNTTCGFDLEAYFTVTVKDQVWPEKEGSQRVRVKDYFSFYTPIPVGVDIDWSRAATTKYYEGYVIGSEVSDWQGVKVTVTYKDEEGNTSSTTYTDANAIYNLGIVLSPINVRQKFVTIESIDGHYIGKASNLPTGFELLYREVESIEIDTTTTANKTKYTEGDTLNLNGIKAIIHYNYGDDIKISITNDDYFTTSPKNGDELTTSDKEVLIVYTDPNTGTKQDTTLPITVTAKPEAAKEIKKIQLLSSNGAKRDYFIGEAFDPEGFEFLLVYSDASTDVKDLADYKSGLTVDSNKYNNSTKQFTAALDGDLKVNFSITYSGTKYNVSLTIPNITVTKRPVLESISVNADKVDYLEGEAPQVKDFVITAKYDDKSQRVFEVADDVTGANKTSYTTTIGGVTYTVKLTPTMVEGDTTKIRVTYSEKASGATAVSKYADVEIDVTIPDAILTYYDTTERTYITKAYEDLLDALDKAEEIADSYGSTYASRIPELELRRDVTMVSDFPTTESLNIDLNGHVLTMIRGEIYVSSRASTGVEVVFSNSDKADAKLVYSSDEDDTVIIAYNDTYTIDKSTTNAGKYEVVISAVKNGKVTGPDEVTHGHDAQFTITPNEDYEIATIKVNNKTQSIPTDGKLIVENVQAKLTVTVTFKEKAWDNPFTDVYKSATYYKSVQFVYENGLFNGTSATKFEPDTTMTRAMFVTVLGRLAGVNVDNYRSSSFKDVPTGEWYSEYVQWASSIGLVEGYGNGKFGPNDAITHAQMYVLMQRYAGLIERMNTNVSGVSIPANDVKDIPTWAYEGVEFAAKHSFLVTSSNRLTPNANAKRSELAMLLDRFCTNVLEWDE